MARRADDATVLLRMSHEERELVNRAFGRGKVNTAAVNILIEAARAVVAQQPALGQLELEEVTAAA